MRSSPVWRLRGIVALALAILGAFALRVRLLGNQNVWWDESLAIWAVRKSWLEVTLWTAADVHPPLYFWALKAWVSLAGESEFSARFLSLICGLLTVAAMYPLGKLLLGRRIALGALLLLAFSRFHVWWSQEMRMYIMATFWGVLSIYTMLRWFQAEGWTRQTRTETKPGSTGWRVLLYGLTTAAGLYTLYLFVTILLIENLFALSLFLQKQGGERRRLLVRWALAQIAVLTLFVPWLATALPRMRSWSVAEPFNFSVFLRLYFTLLTLGISTYIERYTWLVAPFLLLCLAGLVLVWRERHQAEQPRLALSGTQTALLLWLFLLIPPAVVYALTRPRGLFYSPRVEARYLVLFAPAFCLLLAWSVSLLHRRAKVLAWASALLIAIVFLWTLPGHYSGRYLRDELQTMVRAIAAYAEPDDAVIVVSGSRYPIFEYYYGRLPQGPTRPVLYFLPQHDQELAEGNVDAELSIVASGHPRLWLAQVDVEMQDPSHKAAQWLGHRYSHVLDFAFAHNSLTLFAPAAHTAQAQATKLAPQYPLVASLGPGTELRGSDSTTSEFRPGDTIHWAVYYSSQQAVQAVLKMLDAKGRVLQLRDLTLSAEPWARQQVDLPIYAYTPAGQYHFEITSAADQVTVRVGKVQVTTTRPLLQPGTPPVSLSAVLEDNLELLGYALRDSSGRPVDVASSGQTLTLDLYWRASSKVSRDYTVFAHLVGQAYNPVTAGPVWAGDDSQPVAGGYPTTQWFAQDTVVDRHPLAIDAQAPTGEYELEIGMYLLDTMRRLEVTTATGKAEDGRVVLTRLQVHGR